MTVRPKLSRTSAAVIERLGRKDPRQQEFNFEAQEFRREHCEDDEGNRYTVIVWRPVRGLSYVEYTLDDGTPVKFVDDCMFEVEGSGIMINRCP